MKEKLLRNKKKICLGVLILLALLMFLYFGFRPGGLFRKKEAVIPDVHKMSREKATVTIREELKKAGIYNVIIQEGWIDAGSAYALKVVSQYPKAGTVVRKGDMVEIVLYIGEGWDSIR